MTFSSSSVTWQRTGLILGILLIASTLRAPFTAVAPLLDTLRAAFSLTTTQAGLLTTLPLLAFAIVSPMVARIAGRWGIERLLLAALLTLCLGIFLRSTGSVILLYLGTALIGCGIAIGNVLLPSLVKRDFSHCVAKLTGGYFLVMGIAAAIASVIIIPLAHAGFGWSGALFSLILFPILALLLWLPQLAQARRSSRLSPPTTGSTGVWSSALAWHITLYIGINSFIYYVVIGWLPGMLTSAGYSEEQAGSLHGLLQLATAVPGLCMGIVLSRIKDQRLIAGAMAALWLVCVLGLAELPQFAAIWICFGGFGSGAALILGLSFIALRTACAQQAAALSGMAQCIGYLLAAAGPPLIGKIKQLSGSWTSPLLLLAILSCLMVLFGVFSGQQRQIEPQSKG